MLNTDKTEEMAVGDLSRLRLVDNDSAEFEGISIPFKTPINMREIKLTRLSPSRIRSAKFVEPLFLN